MDTGVEWVRGALGHFHVERRKAFPQSAATQFEAPCYLYQISDLRYQVEDLLPREIKPRTTNAGGQQCVVQSRADVKPRCVWVLWVTQRWTLAGLSLRVCLSMYWLHTWMCLSSLRLICAWCGKLNICLCAYYLKFVHVCLLSVCCGSFVRTGSRCLSLLRLLAVD